MSYLLTEIALEMLGYKFYDTNGIFHLTNFQNNTTLSESHPDEPSLTEFIEQAESADGFPPGQTSQKDADPVAGPSNALTLDSHNPRRTPAKALAKILDYESDKIVNQISARLQRSVVRRAAGHSEELLGEVVDEERRLIKEDAAEMRKFREFLQSRLQRLDKRPYEKYVRTFGAE
ncbi:uncharacterized protein LOC108098218 [Drosophila ficusphila]|uniref:uncharacterized protein LOC108098218 n=1 Tax=Drosophila ficusphila TaxID=30025 RepID=UPI0007E876FB|nr:uncharacterized protein LOC108098218 [Drosophila ficusphila]